MKFSPLQNELMDATLKSANMSMMLGAPEVLQVGANFLRLIKAKKALDVGEPTFSIAFRSLWCSL